MCLMLKYVLALADCDHHDRNHFFDFLFANAASSALAEHIKPAGLHLFFSFIVSAVLAPGLSAAPQNIPLGGLLPLTKPSASSHAPAAIAAAINASISASFPPPSI